MASPSYVAHIDLERKSDSLSDRNLVVQVKVNSPQNQMNVTFGDATKELREKKRQVAFAGFRNRFLFFCAPIFSSLARYGTFGSVAGASSAIKRCSLPPSLSGVVAVLCCIFARSQLYMKDRELRQLQEDLAKRRLDLNAGIDQLKK